MRIEDWGLGERTGKGEREEGIEGSVSGERGNERDRGEGEDRCRYK